MFLALDTELVTGGRAFFENQWAGALFFLAPAKLPRSGILNNSVDKIITAIKKIVEIALVAAEPTRKWHHTVKICL